MRKRDRVHVVPPTAPAGEQAPAHDSEELQQRVIEGQAERLVGGQALSPRGWRAGDRRPPRTSTQRSAGATQDRPPAD